MADAGSPNCKGSHLFPKTSRRRGVLSVNMIDACRWPGSDLDVVIAIGEVFRTSFGMDFPGARVTAKSL